jgi:chromate reductase
VVASERLPLIKIFAISGSLRAASTNSALLAALAAGAPETCRVTVYDGLGRLPIFNPDDEGERTPAEAARLIGAVTQADGVIVSCPEYAHGVPGGMKNALDWLVSRDAAVGKPAMLVHASARSLYARAALSEVMRTMSFALYEERVLEIALLGKKPAEIEMILSANRLAMREALQDFAGFIGRH